jgi:hypothetical protein
MDWNLVDLEMLTSSAFVIQTGAVTQRLANRHPASFSAWQAVLFFGVRRNKPWLPCHQWSRNMSDLAWLRRKQFWLRRFVGGIGISEVYNGEPVTILADNQGSIRLAQNDSTSKRTKHIDIRYHFTKNAILEGEITLKYCSTTEMVADMMTKALGKVKLDEFVKLTGLVRTSG